MSFKSSIIALLILGTASIAKPQDTSHTAFRVRKGSSLPATCKTGDVYFKTSATIGTYQCTATNTWTAVPTSSGSVSSATTNQVAIYTGSTTVGGVTPSTAGKVLTSNGTESAPSFETPVTTSITRGVFASAPACSTAVFEYITTDWPGIFHCNGSSSGQWFLNYGGTQDPAANTSWTGWINQTSASVATKGGSILLSGTTIGSDNIQARYITVPSTPYSMTACFEGFHEATPSILWGIFTSNGTTASDKVITFGAQARGATNNVVASFENHNSFTGGGSASTGSYVGAPSLGSKGPHCLTLSDNGTNRKAWVTAADGSTRTLVGSVGNTAFLTATHVGIFVNATGSGIAPVMLVYSFTIVSENI